MSGEETATITIDGKKLLEHTPSNPAPLGLVATGLTLVLLSFTYTGFFPVNSMILAMTLAFGGTGCLIVGVMENSNGNTFATLAFGAFGGFWFSFAILSILPQLNLAPAANPVSLAAYLFMWGIWGAVMFIITLKISRGLQAIFLLITLLFFILGAGALTGSGSLNIIGGYLGIIVGLLAMYVGLAEVANEIYGKAMLPT
ncbi:MAG: putative membrane protein [Methanobacterium sp. Maddingley MBC34]|nr:MAG: putative membrane protein [Methanobacterium sp. Maddingley MBC34]